MTVGRLLVPDAAVTRAIEEWCRAVETGLTQSPMAGVLAVQQLGTRIQTGHDPEGQLARWEPGALRFCSPAQRWLLWVCYSPNPPRLRWVRRVTHYHEGEPMTDDIQVRRCLTADELARVLGLETAREAREQLAAARDAVRQSLQKTLEDET